jgi:hypothetical protein
MLIMKTFHLSILFFLIIKVLLKVNMYVFFFIVETKI